MNLEIYILIMLFIVSMMGICIFAVDVLMKNRNNRYNAEIKRIELDKNREYYEERLFKIQAELLENERRWQDVNNLIVSAQGNNTVIKSNEEFIRLVLQNFGISNLDLSIDTKSVFVLTSFLNREYETFEAIKRACLEVNLNCTRGDEVYRDKDILSHIITSIAKSSVIIANLNGRNPNVFYELGICHSLGKPVILISKNKNKLPFDIQNKNIIFYNDLNSLQEQLNKEFTKIYINKI